MEIIVYTKTGCPWCIGVTSFLKEQGMDFEEKNVTQDENLMKEMVELSGQSKAPVVVLNGTILADTDKEAVQAFLEGEGEII